MINGKILFTPDAVARWLKEALSVDQRNKETDRHTAWYPDGATIIRECIEQHCRTWHFGIADQQLIENHVFPLYRESREFLEI